MTTTRINKEKIFFVFIEYIRDVLVSFSKDHLKGLERVY